MARLALSLCVALLAVQAVSAGSLAAWMTQYVFSLVFFWRGSPFHRVQAAR